MAMRLKVDYGKESALSAIGGLLCYMSLRNDRRGHHGVVHDIRLALVLSWLDQIRVSCQCIRYIYFHT